jgi:hypothetical protein
MKGRKQIPACDFNPDQLTQLLSALDQYDPTAWMISNVPRDADCFTDDYDYVMRSFMEKVLAETAVPFAQRQWDWLLGRGYRAH